MLARELARTAELTVQIRGIEMDLREEWDRYEAKYQWAFGPRGIYPEIPTRWYAVIFRLVERLDAALDDERKVGFRFSQIKEKFGTLRVYYDSDDRITDEVADRLIGQAEAEVMRIETVAKRLQ